MRRLVDLWILTAFVHANYLAAAGEEEISGTRENVTIIWDVRATNVEIYDVFVYIINNQLNKNISGWMLNWIWNSEEDFIWTVGGANVTAINTTCPCLDHINQSLPHPLSCAKSPTIMDVLPPETENLPFDRCCKAGFISSASDQNNNVAAFHVIAGNMLCHNESLYNIGVPANFNIGLPASAYKCIAPIKVTPVTNPYYDTERELQPTWSWYIPCYHMNPRRRSSGLLIVVIIAIIVVIIACAMYMYFGAVRLKFNCD